MRLRVIQPTMSKHLRILRDAGVVVSEKERTTVWCRVTPEFRQRLRNGKQILDLGCCTFRFDEPLRQHSIKNVGTTPATYHVIKWNSPGMLRKRLLEKKEG